MSVSTVRRMAVPASVLAVVAILIALLSPAFASEPGTSAQGHAHDTTAPRALTPRQAVFHDQMRKLWEDHVTWTRLAIVTFADDDAGFDATAGRLLHNQTDIGNAIKPFYGKPPREPADRLLHDHITIAVELLQAAKTGNTAAFEDASTRWYANADDIADFLAAANPRYWPQAAMRASMKEHLDQTLARGPARTHRQVRRQRHRLRGHPRPHPDNGRHPQRRTSSAPSPTSSTTDLEERCEGARANRARAPCGATWSGGRSCEHPRKDVEVGVAPGLDEGDAPAGKLLPLRQDPGQAQGPGGLRQLMGRPVHQGHGLTCVLLTDPQDPGGPLADRGHGQRVRRPACDSVDEGLGSVGRDHVTGIEGQRIGRGAVGHHADDFGVLAE